MSPQLSGYDEERREMEGQPREEYVASLRRRSSGFARGVSKYRGVARFISPHHHHFPRQPAGTEFIVVLVDSFHSAGIITTGDGRRGSGAC
jgi:hypothetical protein